MSKKESIFRGFLHPILFFPVHPDGASDGCTYTYGCQDVMNLCTQVNWQTDWQAGGHARTQASGVLMPLPGEQLEQEVQLRGGVTSAGSS